MNKQRFILIINLLLCSSLLALIVDSQFHPVPEMTIRRDVFDTCLPELHKGGVFGDQLLQKISAMIDQNDWETARNLSLMAPMIYGQVRLKDNQVEWTIPSAHDATHIQTARLIDK